MVYGGGRIAREKTTAVINATELVKDVKQEENKKETCWDKKIDRQRRKAMPHTMTATPTPSQGATGGQR